jgi:hypothetical protein
LWATGAMFAIGAFATIAMWAAFETYWSAPLGRDARELDNWVASEDAQSAVLAFVFLLWLVAFILVVIWSNQAYKSAASYRFEGMRWSSGWAVGGWFIPAANLVIPKLVLNEIERVSSYVDPARPATGQAWRQQRLSAVGIVFWVALWTGFVANLVASAAYPSDLFDLDPDALRFSYMSSVIGFCSLAVACITAASFVRKVGRRLTANVNTYR